MKGNINMEKQKRITLNADKRKVIANVFQDHFETNSKFKKSWHRRKRQLYCQFARIKQKLKSMEKLM